MPTTPDRWEHGSDFHWLDAADAGVGSSPGPELAFASGRDALRAVLEHGRDTFGWRRLWVPSYFCQEVLVALAACRLQLVVYPDAPDDNGAPPRLDTLPADVVLIHNPFGLRAQPPPLQFAGPAPATVEDHTHDPWSRWATTSTADFCAASLRKTLPLPAGAVVWSPRGHSLPQPRALSADRAAAADAKLAAMLLKANYLAGGPTEKAAFRSLALRGEELIATGAISGIPATCAAMLRTFPCAAWRAKRRCNHAQASAALAHLPWAQVLKPEDASSCPFSVVLVVDSAARREALRQKLLEARVYPAVLWPLCEPAVAGIPERHIELSRRLMSIHCDMRYSPDDMARVCELVGRLGESTP